MNFYECLNVIDDDVCDVTYCENENLMNVKYCQNDVGYNEIYFK